MDFPRAITVFFAAFLIYLAAQIYLFIRVRDYARSHVRDEKRRKLLLGLTGALFLFMLYPLLWRAFFGFRAYEPYPWPLRGVLAFWVVGSFGASAILLGYDLFRRLAFRKESGTISLQRRDFLRKSVGVAATAPFILSGYGVLLERRRFAVEHFDLPVNGLSSSLSQLRIVQLTDIHLGPFMPEEELLAYVEAANRLQPDLVALTGDFVSTNSEEIAPCARALSQLNARYGVFACLGNHDVYAGAEEELTRLFGEKGIRMLRNEAISVRIKDTVLNVLGIDDLRWGTPNLARALRATKDEPGEVRLLLSHRPEVFPEAAQKGIEVVLAGHYHGGQVKLGSRPESFSIARLITPYAEGLFYLSRRSQSSRTAAKDQVLFVSRGIGITGLPIRINCRPQIAHLTLRKA